jgi:hypothetical protein
LVFYGEAVMKNHPLVEAIQSFMRNNHPQVEIVGFSYLQKTDTLLLRGHKPGCKGSVRFIVEKKDGCFVRCTEITTSDRKRLGKAALKR